MSGATAMAPYSWREAEQFLAAEVESVRGLLARGDQWSAFKAAKPYESFDHGLPRRGQRQVDVQHRDRALTLHSALSNAAACLARGTPQGAAIFLRVAIERMVSS